MERQFTGTVIRTTGSWYDVRTDAGESVTQFNLIGLRVANTPQSTVLMDDIKLELLKAAKP